MLPKQKMNDVNRKKIKVICVFYIIHFKITVTPSFRLQLYRITKEAFEDLCGLLRQHTELKSTQRVSLESKVLCALLFYAHGDYQRVVGEANHFSQEAMSLYIEEVTAALNHPTVVNMHIRFPATRQDRDLIKQSFYSKYGIPGVGCVECSHFRIFKPDCEMLSVNPKFGGATHDAFMWDNSIINNYMKSLHRNHETVWLLGDSGYPQRPWMMTPYRETAPHSIQELFNKKHSTARVVIENTFGRLKKRNIGNN